MNIFPIYKELGVSCLNSYKYLKRLYKKIGHMGTIDMHAQGILVLFTNEDTKLIDKLSNCSKKYTFTIIYGIQTSTDDIFGNLEKEDTTFSHNDFEICISKFIKQYSHKYFYQVAPSISAKKINGVPMYKIKNKDSMTKYTMVKILNMKATYLSRYYSDIYIEAIGGIYIRSIARDIGFMSKSFACASNINRICSLGYKYSDCINK